MSDMFAPTCPKCWGRHGENEPCETYNATNRTPAIIGLLRCKTCRYNIKGFCHRMPPAARVIDDGTIQAVWPPANDEYGCGMGDI